MTECENLGFVGFRIKFEQNKTSAKPNKNRKKNIIWFNPSYSANVTTKIGIKFLQILDKYSPNSNKFQKLLNLNNVKFSYSSLPYFASIINAGRNGLIKTTL